MCWMYPVYNDSVCDGQFMSASHTQFQYIPIIQKGIWKPFAVLLVDLPRFRIALISHSSAGMRVLLLSDPACKYALFSFLKEEEKIRLEKKNKQTNKLLTESGASWHTEPTNLMLHLPTCPLATFFMF